MVTSDTCGIDYLLKKITIVVIYIFIYKILFSVVMFFMYSQLSIILCYFKITFYPNHQIVALLSDAGPSLEVVRFVVQVIQLTLPVSARRTPISKPFNFINIINKKDTS